MLERDGRVALRYVAAGGSAVGARSPNGSMRDIAGVLNQGHNVLGMMPHPERASEALLGSDDGMRLFESVSHAVRHGDSFANIW